MKKADIYEIAIKILGVYLFVINLSKLPSFFTLLKTFSNISSADYPAQQMNLFWLNIVNLVLMLCFALFLIVGNRFITRLITNAADRQENVKLFADSKQLYEVALIIIGGLLIVNALPDLLYRLYNLSTANDQNAIMSSISKILTGLLIVAFGKRIAAFFAK